MWIHVSRRWRLLVHLHPWLHQVMALGWVLRHHMAAHHCGLRSDKLCASGNLADCDSVARGRNAVRGDGLAVEGNWSAIRAVDGHELRHCPWGRLDGRL